MVDRKRPRARQASAFDVDVERGKIREFARATFSTIRAISGRPFARQ